MEQSSNLENVLRDHLDGEKRRLDRIETKIDKLSEFVVQLARVEEKIEVLEYSRENLGKRVKSIEETQINAVMTLDAQTRVLQTITRLGWVLVTTAITGVVGITLYGGVIG
jgi:septation ring formation regulator EzrA|tara:strand:+ start:615 stop:947 length:333 start_codon:yes stop_codon:yes gene_type:complete